MNYILLILIIFIVLLISNNYINNGTNYQDKNNNNLLTDKNTGFVKPEHRLLKIFNNISTGSKIKLDGKCSQYIDNKNTITKELNDKLLILLKEAVHSINILSKNDYYLKKIENVFSLIDRKLNQRYIIDFFIYDIKNFYTIRLIADIVVIDDDIYINYLNIQSGSNSALLDKYDVKYNSSGILFNADMFHNNLVDIFDSYYKNNFNVIGVNDTNLEYSSEDLSDVYTLNSLKRAYLPSNLSSDDMEDLEKKDLSGYIEMYLPNNQTQIKSSVFCNKYKLEWDKYGIPNEINNKDNNCYVNNNHTSQEINEPWFGPGVINERVSQNNYDWIKDPAIGNIIRGHGYRV